MKVMRDHDKFYLNEATNVKEYFKFIVEKSAVSFAKHETPRVLDVGCATGDFIYYISKIYSKCDLFGMDVDSTLLEAAKMKFPEISFFLGDITKKDIDLKFDIVFMNGVHSIFDDFLWLENVVSLVDWYNGGKAYVFGIFNSNPIDVLVKVRSSNSMGPWQAGWNCPSKDTILTLLSEMGGSGRFIDWNINIDIPPRKDDPLRSWTFSYQDGRKGVVNGSMILHEFSLLEISFNR